MKTEILVVSFKEKSEHWKKTEKKEKIETNEFRTS